MNANTNTYRIVSDLFGGEQFATREELQTVADMFGTRLEFVGDRVFARWVREWDDEARELTELVAVLHGEDNDNDSDEYDNDEAAEAAEAQEAEADAPVSYYRHVSWFGGSELFATKQQLEAIAQKLNCELEFVGDKVFAHWVREDDEDGHGYSELVALLIEIDDDEAEYEYEAEGEEAEEADEATTTYRVVSNLLGGEEFATRDELQTVADMFGTRLEFVGDRVFATWVREWDDEAREYSELVAVLDTDDDE